MSQPVVQPYQLPDRLRLDAVQKAAKSRRIGKALQTQQRKEQAIVLQDFGLADSPQPSHQDIQQGQEQIRWLKVPTAMSDAQIALQQPSQTQALTKMLHQDHSSKMSQVGILEGKLQCSQAFSHREQAQTASFCVPAISSLKVNILPDAKKRDQSLVPRDFFDVRSPFHAFLRFNLKIFSPIGMFTCFSLILTYLRLFTPNEKKVLSEVCRNTEFEVRSLSKFNQI
jgi:hypothetical protein